MEDEVLLRIIIADALNDEGFAVFEAANSVEAVEILLSQTEIRAIFTDTDMPGDMKGFGLAALVRDRWPPDGSLPPKPYRVEEVSGSIRELLAV